MKNILVTGGAGYIGSHTCVDLLNDGYNVIVVDNLSNSSQKSLDRVQKITGKSLTFHKVDLLNKKKLERVFKDHKIDAVIHFAGLKAVGESVEIPLSYYKNNISGTINLLITMQENNVKKIVFSSSAAVYGDPNEVPTKETTPTNIQNTYARTKLHIEEMLKDLFVSDNTWSIIALRYFNPVGAHESGEIGEDPKGIPNNLFPYITQVAVGRRKVLSVFGGDYDTKDGTAIRDYIHVVDLAKGHLSSLKKLNSPIYKIYNLGTGKGYSVLDVIKAFEKASGKKIPFKITQRRAGDPESYFADPTLAQKELGWKAEKTLDQMCVDGWRWQSKNPKGFR